MKILMPSTNPKVLRGFTHKRPKPKPNLSPAESDQKSCGFVDHFHAKGSSQMKSILIKKKN